MGFDDLIEWIEYLREDLLRYMEEGEPDISEKHFTWEDKKKRLIEELYETLIAIEFAKRKE